MIAALKKEGSDLGSAIKSSTYEVLRDIREMIAALKKEGSDLGSAIKSSTYEVLCTTYYQ